MVACLGVSEPGAGSDVAGLQTTARQQGDDLIINGQKLWITNACQADWICLLANTSIGPPHRNKSLICVPMKTPGEGDSQYSYIAMGVLIFSCFALSILHSVC